MPVNQPRNIEAALFLPGELQHFTEQTAAECFVLDPLFPGVAAWNRAEIERDKSLYIENLRAIATFERRLALGFGIQFAPIFEQAGED